ncbi:secretin N-terminal domain-containing protein [Sideroxydans sp. CL21]|uniref:secretin N-terminal domain-containing protein n=1 Tax=Sideroxydans sp. CL21 TaxID=2600596 RepID=UPI0024BBF055|nr:secretin N-terminal domain-containing protein [Sideroxydans sp. CL21]
MKRVSVLLTVLLLSACATGGNPKNVAAEKINQEMDAAVASHEAAKQEAVNQALLPPLAVATQSDSKPPETRFDLAVNSTPAKQVFMAIVSGTRYSVLVHPDVSGNISLSLKDVTVFDALESIRELYGYEYKVDGTRIYIQPLTLQTRIFQVNYLTGNRAGTSSVRVTSSALTDSSSTSSAGGAGGGASQNMNQGTTIVGGGENKNLKFERGTDNSSKVTTTTSTDFWNELSLALKTIVGDEKGRSIVISPMSGVIVIRAMPDELRSVSAYLKASQISIERQVILEAKIVEVQLNESFQSGVNWAIFKNGPNSHLTAGQGSPGSSLTQPGTALSSIPLTATAGSSLLPTATTALPAGTTPGTMFGMAFQNSNFASLLNFLETQGDVHVLSSPRIATLNNQKAVLKVGTDEFFVTGVTGGMASTQLVPGIPPTVTVQPFFSGIALDVTPRIDENNEIILHVHPSVSTVSTVNKFVDLGVLLGTMNLPLASSSVSETDSIVRARDGQIVAIGGLMRQAETNDNSGIPGLPKSIFGQTNRTTEKRELVILIKPTVVDSDKDWSDDIARSRERLSNMSK